MDLVRNDPGYNNPDKKSAIRLASKNGESSFTVKTTEKLVRREWFERLIERGNNLQREIDEKGSEYNRLDDLIQPVHPVRLLIEASQEKLSRVVLDLETLDALVFPVYRRYLKNNNYFDLRGRIERNIDRSQDAVDQAAGFREKFFGKAKIPIWMNNTVIVPQIAAY